MLKKRKWMSVNKNPENLIKNPQKLQQWSNLQDMPKKTINNVLNEKILRLDQAACDNLIAEILVEKRNQER